MEKVPKELVFFKLSVNRKYLKLNKDIHGESGVDFYRLFILSA
jgi:hypothetical protein